MESKSTPLFQLLLLLLTTRIIASGRQDTRRAKSVVLAKNSRQDPNLYERKLSVDDDIDERELSVYALYSLDTFSVRLLTARTAELESVRPAATLEKDAGTGDYGDGWMLVSETGGLRSSLSYPIRSVTQDFMYLAFQNLVDDWLLELSGGPDGNNDLSFHNSNATYDGDSNNRLLTRAAQRKIQAVNIAGGDSTGEENYNAGRLRNDDKNIAGTDLDVAEETGSVEIPTDALFATQNQQQSESLETEAISTEISTGNSDSKEEEQDNRSPQPEPLPAHSTITTIHDLEAQEIEATEVPTSTDYVYSTQEELQQESSQSQSDAARESTLASQVQGSNKYVDLYDGLVYHNMYGHLVTVDLRVKLYLRKDGYPADEDSLRRNLRMLQTDHSGDAELLAEMTPTIAFLEPVSEDDKLTKPSNIDVMHLFGVWMQYLFGKQQDVYIRTLREYPDQDMLQEISRLRVDVGVSSFPSTQSSNSPRNSYTETWSEQTQKILIILLVVLGTIAVIWPMFTWAQHRKKSRRLSLQLMHGGLPLDGADDLGDSFSSCTYRDNIHDMIKLPPINPSVEPPNSSLPRPQTISMIERVSSLDDARHGKDIFPSKYRSDSQKNAISVLEASDRYLSRNRPDLFYDKQVPESKGTVNVFGRVYEIPSNPFEFIYKGGQQEPPSEPTDNHPPASTGMDLGRAAHFPFASPRSSFTSVKSNPFPGRSTSVGSNPFPGRSTSVGSVGNNSAGSANHFTQIVVSNQNLAAGMNDEFDDEWDVTNRITAVPGVAAHTGHTWQNNAMPVPPSHYAEPPYSDEGNSGGIIGNIFRNLSISSWYGGTSLNNSYTSNSHLDPDFHPTSSSDTKEVYYDNYHYQHQPPSLLQSEIELESLPNDEEDPESYDFAFQDFPRKDGTPCLIVDDDSFLSERKRRESAKAIFNFGDDHNDGNASDGSVSEKKIDDLPLSNEAFKLMLSQNALEIDNSILNIEDGDGSIELPPLEGSFLSKDPHDAKSPEFQKKLSRLMETKRQRYTRENKNAAIVAANRKKRKNVRERERVDRHKAIERELEDIEAEFSLTMQPVSPDRNKFNNSSSSIHSRTTPKRNAPSPKPSTGRFSPMPSRRAHSPARKNIATLSPTRPNSNSHSRRAPSPAIMNLGTLSPPRPNPSNILVPSPARSNIPRRGGSHMRQNSLGGGHQKQNSLGASPFRTFSPRTRYPSSDISQGVARSRSASQRSVSPPNNQASKFRSTNLHGADRSFFPSTISGGSQYDDLSLPSMNTAGEKGLESSDAKFPSPQAVIDEALQSGAQNSLEMPRNFATPKRRHQRSLTPSRIGVSQAPPAQQKFMRKRTNSLDVNDDSYHRRIHSASSYSTTSSQIIRQSPSTISNINNGHRRTASSGMGSSHKRSNSRNEDIFLHGVVAQTRFI